MVLKFCLQATKGIIGEIPVTCQGIESSFGEAHAFHPNLLHIEKISLHNHHLATTINHTNNTLQGSGIFL
jgi:hypothetical protein